jgi:hypothetical protein
MIVPAWAEGRVHEKRDGKQVTIRRFGWSDESQAAAQAHADDRAREAFAAFKASGTTARFEYKRAYNGADGVPIREEILERHGDTIITRNSYGARSLPPNVLFADVDVRTEIRRDAAQHLRRPPAIRRTEAGAGSVGRRRGAHPRLGGDPAARPVAALPDAGRVPAPRGAPHVRQ